MPRTTVALAVVMVVAAAAACATGPAPNHTALDEPLTFGEAAEFRFVAEHSGPHQAIIQFGWPIVDQMIDRLVASAATTTGAPGAPAFDFSWRIIHEGATVAQRESPQRSTGVIDTHASGLGAGPRVSRGLVFGGCNLEAGRAYTVRVEPGAQFKELAKAQPRIVVAYQPTVLRSS